MKFRDMFNDLVDKDDKILDEYVIDFEKESDFIKLEKDFRKVFNRTVGEDEQTIKKEALRCNVCL